MIQARIQRSFHLESPGLLSLGLYNVSKDLKKRGFRFVGSTICYAFMQATGMVDDHSADCTRRGDTG